MLSLREVNYEIENLGREMARLVIQQNDVDNQLAIYDRRMSFLQAEKLRLETNGEVK